MITLKELKYQQQMDITKTKVELFNKKILDLATSTNGARVTTINLNGIGRVGQLLTDLQKKAQSCFDDLTDIHISYTLANEYYKEMIDGNSI